MATGVAGDSRVEGEEHMTPCPECERNKFRAAMWRAEAYKQAGNDVIERPWVGLTDKEVEQLAAQVWFGGASAGHERFAKLIEAKLKEKNT